MAIVASAHYTITDLNDGVSVSQTKVLYYNSTSSTTMTGGTWSETAPAWEPGKYVWTKTVILYDSSEKQPFESSPVCITGYHGDDGTGVASIEALYYLSDSKDSSKLPAAASDEWKTEPQEWSLGKYLWTRNKVTYTDGLVDYMAPSCDSGWEAVDGLVIGSRNYIKYSKDMFRAEYHVLVTIEQALVGTAIVGVSRVSRTT